MSGSWFLLAWWLVTNIGLADSSPRPPEFSVDCRVEPRHGYQGQVLQLTIEARGAAGEVAIEPPRYPQSRLILLEHSQTTDRARFVYALVPTLVGRRSGSTVRATDQQGRAATAAPPIEVQPVPMAGRPAWFLGGVGSFEIGADVEPDTLPLGRDVIFRLVLKGPGAANVARPPDLARWLDPRWRIQASSATQSSTALETTLVYRLRAVTAGRLPIAPIPIAGFDPTARRYVTKTAPALEVDVRPPALPSESQESPADTQFPRPWRIVAASSVLGLVAVFGVMLDLRHNGRARRIRRLARLIERSDTSDPAALARLVEDALRQAAPKLPISPTPKEVRDAWGDAGLGERAERLLARCDAARYSPTPPAPELLRGDAVALLQALAVGRCLETTASRQ